MRLHPWALVVLLIIGSGIANADERKLVGQWLEKAISESEVLRVNNLKPMKYTPLALPAMSDNGIVASNQAKEKLSKLLLEANEFDPSSRLGSCTFSPGYTLSFYKNNRRTARVLACFNCGVWAIGGVNELGIHPTMSSVTAFGDLKPNSKTIHELLESVSPTPDGFKSPEQKIDALQRKRP